MSQHELSLETHKQALEFLRIGNRAVKRAYELPNGELTKDQKIIDELLSTVEKERRGKH